MSGFFGVFSPGGNIDIDAFNEMQKAINREVYDELETKIDDCIAMGHLMLRVTTESVYDQQPLKSSCGRYMLTGHFRLDYRDDLGDKLGLNHKELEVTPDSTLAMLAYQKWGDKCMSHLEGDWAFVLYDYQNKSLFAARDKFGYSSLFYYKSNNKVYFSSDLDILISALKEIKIDKVHFYLFSLGRKYMGSGCTIFESVFFLQPASWITVNSSSQLFIGRIEFIKFIVKQHYKSEQDYILEYKSSFYVALNQKLKRVNDIGIFLSGGFDSVLISKAVDCQFKLTSKKQFAYTRKPIEIGSTANKYKPDRNEFEVVDKIRSGFENTQFFGSSFSEITYSNLLTDSTKYSFFDPMFTGNSYWMDGIFCEFKKRNLRAVFVGQFGNYTLSWDAPILKLNSSLLYVIRNCLKILFNRFETGKTIFNKRKMFSFMDRWKINIHLLKTQILLLNSFDLRKQLFVTNVYDLGARNYMKGTKYGLLIIDPSADERFLFKSFSIPEKMFNKSGERKYIYKNSFHQFLGSDFFSISTSNVNQAGNISFKISSDKTFVEQFFYLSKIFKEEPFVNKYNMVIFFNKMDKENYVKLNSSFEGIMFLKYFSLMHLYLKSLNLDNDRIDNGSSKKRLAKADGSRT